MYDSSNEAIEAEHADMLEVNSNKSVSSRLRVRANDGTLHRVQAEIQRSRQRPIPNLARQDRAIIRFICQKVKHLCELVNIVKACRWVVMKPLGVLLKGERLQSLPRA
jgi:hypothetical protein